MVHRGRRWELQLKGAGKTPYSRFADGRAVLRSSLREYVASEAFHFLGIPTTRALSLVATNVSVARDMFYDGRVKDEPGAVVCRVAPSFIRFGTFQLPVSRGKEEVHLVKQLADYAIKHHFPEFDGAKDKYLKMLQRVVQTTAELFAKWQLVGFVHGALLCLRSWPRCRITALLARPDHIAQCGAPVAMYATSFGSSSVHNVRTAALWPGAFLSGVLQTTNLMFPHSRPYRQQAGWRAGVLNTDNMSLLGLTIDYGPYGFLDKFDPTWTPNLTDLRGHRCDPAPLCALLDQAVVRATQSMTQTCLDDAVQWRCLFESALHSMSAAAVTSALLRRYCYKQQIEIGQWNLAQLATSLLAADLVSQEQAQEAVNSYAEQVMELHNDGMAAKLGLQHYDEDLVLGFLKLLYASEGDFTNGFRAVSHLQSSEEFASIPERLAGALGKDPDEEVQKVRDACCAHIGFQMVLLGVWALYSCTASAWHAAIDFTGVQALFSETWLRCAVTMQPAPLLHRRVCAAHGAHLHSTR